MDDESELSASQEEPSSSYSLSLASQFTEPMSSYESVGDDPDYDELPDTSVLDIKLNNISITKIDTRFFRKEKTTNDIDEFWAAERIIRKIMYKRKRKHINESAVPGPKEKSPRLDSEVADGSVSNLSSQQQYVTSDTLPSTSDAGRHIGSDYDQRVRSVLLKPQFNNMLKEQGTNYKIKLYLVEAKQDSSFSKIFAKLATEKSRERLCSETEVSKCYILFFYRNIDHTYIKPEIYALTTGSAWRKVSKYADRDFTKLVERRTLRFPFHRVEYKRDSGHVLKETQSARPGHEITFSTWDYLGKLVGKRTRNIRKHSSLYSKSLDAFLTKEGKPIASKVQLSKNTLKIQRKLNISQLGNILDHFSKICSKEEKTYVVNETGDTRIEETDDPMFEMHDFMANVTDKKRIRKLNESLFQVLKKSMNGIDSHIFLIHQSVEKWLTADEFRLYARPQSDTMGATSKQTRLTRKKIATWNEYPSLDAVMLSLRNKCGDKFKEEWLEDVIIKFRSIQAPLKRCIFSRFSTGDIGTYIYHHGHWIEIKAQFLYSIERDFVEMMREHLLQENQLPLLLPWKHPGKNKGKNYKIEEFDRKVMEPKWKIHFENECVGDQFDQVLDEAENLLQGLTGLDFDFQSLEKWTLQKKAACLYALLECNLNEDDYNAAHTLLSMTRPDDAETQVITCDKKTPHGIELCDILMFDDKTTYLVHVKAGFDGGPIREVCSQIRNAADNIYREQSIADGTGIIDKYWKMLTKDATNPKTHENEVRTRLKRMTKDKFKELFHPKREIVFVLACRDTRKGTDFSRDIPQSIGVYMTDEIRKRFTTSQPSTIIEILRKEEYLTPQGILTNKFILEGKDNKETFIENLRSRDAIISTETAKDVLEVLKSGLPKSKSTIAKMEIIRLTKDFKRYWVGERKLQLKIYKIGSDFPDC